MKVNTNTLRENKIYLVINLKIENNIDDFLSRWRENCEGNCKKGLYLWISEETASTYEHLQRCENLS